MVQPGHVVTATLRVLQHPWMAALAVRTASIMSDGAMAGAGSTVIGVDGSL